MPDSLLRDREFLKLWSGETISAVGSQFSGVAIPYMAAHALAADAFQLGILNALSFIAFPLFGLFVGVWADRHKKRPTMIGADLGRMLFLGLIPLFALFYSVTLVLLYVVAFAVGTLQTFFDISYQSYLPYLVKSDQLVEGNSRLQTTQSAATVVGPSLAGFAVQLFGAPWAIFGDVLGYLGSAGFLVQIRRPEAAPPRREAHIRKDIAEGLQVIFKNRNLTAIALCTGTSNLFTNAFGVAALVLMVQIFGFSGFEYGLTFAFGGLGAVAGAVLALRILKKLGVGRSIILGILIGGLPFASFYFVDQSLAFPVAVIAFGMGAFGGVVYNVAQVSYRQALVPLELQGRMNASMRVLVWGPIPTGAIMGGVMGVMLGIRETLLISAVGASLAFVWVLFSPVRRVKEIPQRETGG